MKLFLIKSNLFLLACLVLMFLGDYVVTMGLRKTGYNDFDKINGIMESDLNHDLLIIGGSDAKQHVSPRIIDSLLTVNSINMGLAGHNFILQYLLFMKFIERNGFPEKVIHVINPGSLSKRKELYSRMLFLPYIRDSDVIRYTQMFEGIDWYGYNLPFARYSGFRVLIKVGIFEFFNFRHYLDTGYKGHLSMNFPWNQEVYNKLLNRYEMHFLDNIGNDSNQGNVKNLFDSTALSLFEDYIADLKDNHVEVYVIVSPMYAPAQCLINERDEKISFFQEICFENDFVFIDFSNDEICMNRNNFYDYLHLKTEPSKMFTTFLCEEIINYTEMAIDPN